MEIFLRLINLLTVNASLVAKYMHSNEVRKLVFI